MANGFFSYAKQAKEAGKGAYAFFIILDDEFKEKAMESLKFMHDKLGVHLIVLSDCSKAEDRDLIGAFSDKQFYVPYSGYLSALLCIIPIQLSAFETTYALGRNPDHPRGLTKVVI